MTAAPPHKTRGLAATGKPSAAKSAAGSTAKPAAGSAAKPRAYPPAYPPAHRPGSWLRRSLARLLPERAGIALHYWYTSFYRPKVSPIEKAALLAGHTFRFGDSRSCVAWMWGSGPLVVLVHGWGGHAGHMAPLALTLARSGYTVVAPDITGHGASSGYRIAWASFFRDLAALQEHLGMAVHAYVGHSVGGLAMMAARHISGLRASRYVCVCSPALPSKGAEFLQDRLAPSAAGMAWYQSFVARQFGGATWAELENGACYAGAGDDTLLVYDTEDRFVLHGEGDKIRAHHPQVQMVKLQANGHLRILKLPELAHAVLGFLHNGSPLPTLRLGLDPSTGHQDKASAQMLSAQASA